MAPVCDGWSVARVVQFLRELKLDQYVAAVEANEIDGPVFVDLARSDGLHELGITSMIHKSKIRAALERLGREPPLACGSIEAPEAAETRSHMIAEGSEPARTVASSLLGRAAVVGMHAGGWSYIGSDEASSSSPLSTQKQHGMTPVRPADGSEASPGSVELRSAIAGGTASQAPRATSDNAFAQNKCESLPSALAWSPESRRVDGSACAMPGDATTFRTEANAAEGPELQRPEPAARPRVVQNYTEVAPSLVESRTNTPNSPPVASSDSPVPYCENKSEDNADNRVVTPPRAKQAMGFSEDTDISNLSNLSAGSPEKLSSPSSEHTTYEENRPSICRLKRGRDRDAEEERDPKVKAHCSSKAASALNCPLELKTTVEAQRTLQKVTALLHDRGISAAAAIGKFAEVIDSAPAGKVRCSAMLNRAHCLASSGRLAAALADIEDIFGENVQGFDPTIWHKVWMSYGGICQKLAQSVGGDATLESVACRSYEQVLETAPDHEEYRNKAIRYLEQLRKNAKPLAPAHPCAPQENEVEDACAVPAAKPRRLFVGNLPDGTSDGELRELCARYGDVAEFFISRKGHGRPWALVTFRLAEEAARALEAGQDGFFRMQGLALTVSIARNQQPRSAEPATNRRRDVFAVAPMEASPEVIAARKTLSSLGRDIVSAGRLLLAEGRVLERRAPTPVVGARSRPEALVRTFYVRGASAERLDLVLLVMAGGRALSECSCMLRERCKHVAAALLLVERSADNDAGAVALAASAPGARERRDVLAHRLDRRTLEELKGLLKLNNQLLHGIKPELVLRVADAAVFGSLPACPECRGHLHPESPEMAPDTIYRCKRANRADGPCTYEVHGSRLERKPFVGIDAERCF